MNATAGLGDPLIGLMAVLAIGLILFLARDAIREVLAVRKQRRARERQRQQFWGYE